MKKLFLILTMLLAGCDEWVEPQWIDGPPPPGNAISDSRDLAITEGAAGSLLLIHGFRSWSGEPGTATRAVSHDPSIVGIAITTRDRTVHSITTAEDEHGHVFVIWGIRAGETDLEIFDGDDHFATVHVKVLPQ